MKKRLLGVLTAIGITAAMAGGQVAAEEKMEISMWHVWPENNGGTAASFAKALEEVQEKYPEVEFTIDAVADSGDAYKTKIKTAVAGGEIPDVFYTWGGGFSKAFVESGKLLCMDDYITEETLDKLLPGITDFFKYDDKLYGLPFRSNVAVMFCNQKMFDEAGLEIPETVEELIDVIKAFREQGITPFALGAKSQSDIAWWTDQLAVRTAGVDYINQALSGEATIDTPEIKESVELFRQIIEAGAFDDGALAMSRDEAYATFLAGVYPMYLCGSWFCANVNDSEIKDEVVVASFPVVEGSAGTKTEFLGGADQCFMISNEVENPEKVVEIVAYLCERMSENVFTGVAGLPIWKSDVDVSAVENQTLVQVYDLYKDATGNNIWWDNILTGEQTTNQLDSVAKLYMGNITTDEYMAMNKEIIQ